MLGSNRPGNKHLHYFNDELFTYLESLQEYISEQQIGLIQRIVNAVQYVRKKVNAKNDKYYIDIPVIGAKLCCHKQ